MDKHNIGTSAGTVWQTLNSKERLSFEELQCETQLDTEHLAAAIGWLAREDKICFSEQNGITVYYVYQEKYY